MIPFEAINDPAFFLTGPLTNPLKAAVSECIVNIFLKSLSGHFIIQTKLDLYRFGNGYSPLLESCARILFVDYADRRMNVNDTTAFVLAVVSSFHRI